MEGHTPDRAHRDLHQATRRREDFGERRAERQWRDTQPDRAHRDLHQATRRREDFGESSEETSLQCQD